MGSGLFCFICIYNYISDLGNNKLIVEIFKNYEKIVKKVIIIGKLGLVW